MMNMGVYVGYHSSYYERKLWNESYRKEKTWENIREDVLIYIWVFLENWDGRVWKDFLEPCSSMPYSSSKQEIRKYNLIVVDNTKKFLIPETISNPTSQTIQGCLLHATKVH